MGKAGKAGKTAGKAGKTTGKTGFMSDPGYLAAMRLQAMMSGQGVMMINEWDMHANGGGIVNVPIDRAAMMLPDGRLVSMAEAAGAGYPIPSV